MKVFILIYLCVVSPVAYCQNYIILFDNDGKLKNETYPTIFYRSNVLMDFSNINISKSKLIKRCKNFLKEASTSKHPIFGELQWEQAYLTSIINSYDEKTHIVEFNDRPSKYSPINLESNSNAKKLIWKKESKDSIVASGNLIIDGNKLNKVEYSIVSDDNDNQLVARHLDSTSSFYKGISKAHLDYIRGMRKKARNVTNLISREYMADSLNKLSFNLGLTQQLELFEGQKKQISTIYWNVLNLNKDWIKSWLWYSGGKILLNPFEVTVDTTAILNGIDEQIIELEEELKLWNIVLHNDLSQFENINLEISLISNQISDLKIIRTDHHALGRQYELWINQASKKNKIHYSGVWHLSSKESIRWMNHYDINLDLKNVSKEGGDPNMVSDQDQMIEYVHNVKEGDNVRLVSSTAAFQPKSPLQLSLEEIEKQFSGLSGSGVKLSSLFSFKSVNGFEPFKTSPQTSFFMDGSVDSSIVAVPCDEAINGTLRNLRFDDPDKVEIIGTLIGNCTAETTKDYLLKLILIQDRFQYIYWIYSHFNVEPVAEYQALIDEMRETMDHMEWLLSQTKPPLKIDLKDDEMADFRTVALMPEEMLDITESSKISYSVFHNDEKEAALKSTYKKYRRAGFLPTIGLAYIPSERTGSVFDPAAKQFVAGKRFDNMEVLIGVKWYPIKTNPVRKIATTRLIRGNVGRSANFYRGNSFASKLFVTGGLGVRHDFLKNYYLGAGLDIFPGVNAHLGSNLILRKHYQLSNGEILREQQRPTGFWYFALSFDPGIVASLTNIFIK